MKDPLPFDHRPDLVLGRALREALDPGDAQAFTARVVALAGQVRLPSWDAVLARWARTGVAAALVVALAAGYFVGRTTAAPRRARAHARAQQGRGRAQGARGREDLRLCPTRLGPRRDRRGWPGPALRP